MPATRRELKRKAREIAAEFRLDPELFERQIQAESNWDPRAISRAGAQGLGQLMPRTAEELGVTDPFDPDQNLRGAASYMRQQLDAFGGDYKLALAAYNAGAGAVRRHGGVPAYRETQEYVRKVQTQLGQRSPIRRRPAPPARKVRMLQAADGTLRLVN